MACTDRGFLVTAHAICAASGTGLCTSAWVTACFDCDSNNRPHEGGSKKDRSQWASKTCETAHVGPCVPEDLWVGTRAGQN